jgi:anti-anti-sigma regulatory factor
MEKISDHVSIERKNGIAVIFITKILSYEAADDLKDLYPKIPETKILFDLGQVKITTSRGMTTLISIILQAHDKGQQVCLCNVSPVCMNIIDTMDITSHVKDLHIFDTLDKGIAHLQTRE